MTGLRVVRAEGDPHTRGRLIGRGLGDLIEGSIAFYHRYFERRGVESADLQDLLAPYLSAAETNLPESMEMIKGMSEGAMVPVWELFAVNAFEELEPLLEPEDGRPLFLWRKEGYSAPPPAFTEAQRRSRAQKCSTFTVAGPGYTILGHNEHWLAGDVGKVAVVVEYPTEGSTPVASPTVVTCLPAVGMNGLGGAQGIQSLTAADDDVGIPRVLVSRHSLSAADRADAFRRATLPARAGGYSHVLAFRGGDAFTIETTRRLAAIIEGPGPHTNHYLDPELAAIGAEPSPGSMSRYQRLQAVIAERRPTSPEDVMSILQDHEAAPQSVCLHPDDEEADEASAVVFSMVCDLEGGRMWVAPGNPCTAPYEEVDLAGVV